MKARHRHLRNTTNTTPFGVIHHDETGVVTNQADLAVTPEQLVSSVAGYVDGDVFPGTPPPPVITPVPGARMAQTSLPSGTGKPDPTDEQYGEIITEMLKSGAPVNGEGYVDMTALNEVLRDRNLKILTGSRRKEITDKLKLNPKSPSAPPAPPVPPAS
jgi:hypothetical protein